MSIAEGVDFIAIVDVTIDFIVALVVFEISVGMGVVITIGL